MSWGQLGLNIYEGAYLDFIGYSTSLSNDGTIVAIGAIGDDYAGTDSGSVSIFQYSNHSWSQLGSTIDGDNAGDYSGYSVSLSDDGQIVAIGAVGDDYAGTDSGSVSIFQYSNNDWNQLGNFIEGDNAGDYYGKSVSLSGDGTTVAIGAEGGYAEIWQYSDNSWTQLGDDINGDNAGDYFGNSVSLSDDGNIVAIGAVGDDYAGIDSGSVSIFQYSNNDWNQLGNFIEGDNAGDYYGKSVSLSGDGTTVAIGAEGGYAEIWQYLNNSWTQLGDDIDGDNAGDYFGNSVSLSDDGNIVAIGAIGDDYAGTDSGSVSIFQYSNHSWSQLGSTIDGEAAGDHYGSSVSLSADATIVAIGAIGNDYGVIDSGSVSIFSNSSTYFDDGDASFSIIGNKSPGNYLSIKRDSQDPDGTGELTYQWQTSSNGTSWTNASTKSSYKLRIDDSNKFVRAVISYTDSDGFDESIETSSVKIDNHSLSNSIYSNFGYSEVFGTNSSDSITSLANQIVWGLGGDDKLSNSYSSEDQYLIGGSGDDTYTIKSGSIALVYEAPNQGNDVINIESSYEYGYVATLDNSHLVAIEDSYGDSGIIVLNALEKGGVDEIYFNGAAYSTNYFLSIISSFPGYLGNITWDYLKPTLGDLGVNAAKNLLNEIQLSAASLENSFSNLDSNSSEILNVSQIVGNSYQLTAIRDYDGNFHANTGSVSDATKSAYKYQGQIDVNADGIKEAIYTNKESGRWVTASINSSTGEIDYSDHGSGGTTRIVGIYIDPLVTSGAVEQFGPHDSQRRFQNDLKIDNLIAKTSGDYDGDSFQEVYWKTNDGTAYLRALMHADGNIQYANYQSKEQMSDYLTSKGFESEISSII